MIESFFGLVSAGLQPLFGALVDRVGRRKPFIMGGLGLMALGTLALVVADHYWELMTIRAVQGVGVALTIPASLALMAAASRKRTRGGSMGIYTTFRMIGIAGGPILGGFLYDRVGFEPAFYASAALEKQFNDRLDQTAFAFGIAFRAPWGGSRTGSGASRWWWPAW